MPKISKNYIIGILYKTLQSLKLDNTFEIYFIINYYIKYTRNLLHVLDVEQDDSFNQQLPYKLNKWQNNCRREE
jgi:hypothetical protein